jgi:hypothetical protein
VSNLRKQILERDLSSRASGALVEQTPGWIDDARHHYSKRLYRVLDVTVALVGKRYIITRIEGVGSNLVYAGLTHSSNPSRLALSDEISPGDFDAVKSDIPQVMVATSAPTSATTSGFFSLLNRRVNDFEDTPCGSEEDGNPPSEDMPQLIENVGGPARIRT